MWVDEAKATCRFEWTIGAGENKNKPIHNEVTENTDYFDGNGDAKMENACYDSIRAYCNNDTKLIFRFMAELITTHCEFYSYEGLQEYEKLAKIFCNKYKIDKTQV